MNEKEWKELKVILRAFDSQIYDEYTIPKIAEEYVYAVVDFFTKCKECGGKGYTTEVITECNGGESAPEWSGEYQVQCYCTYEMPLRDEIAYERWQMEGELVESKNCNTC